MLLFSSFSIFYSSDKKRHCNRVLDFFRKQLCSQNGRMVRKACLLNNVVTVLAACDYHASFSYVKLRVGNEFLEDSKCLVHFRH